MANVITQFNWICLFLILFTTFLVVDDRAFSHTRRRTLICILVICLTVSLLGNIHDFSGVGFDAPLSVFLYKCAGVLRASVLFLLMVAIGEWTGKQKLLLSIPNILNIFFVLFDVYPGSAAVLCFYAAMLAASIILTMKKGDTADLVFAAVIIMMILSCVIAEFAMNNASVVNNGLGIIACICYFWMVMRTYKKDGLTGLLLRHNLNFEMADLYRKNYDIVLIDVDNFKLINDKYGHDKGDEALVTVVNTVKDHLCRGCRMYRFGGDEFVIISRKVTQEELKAALEKANSDLEKYDFHISYGVVRHNAGEDSVKSLTQADKVMYENKRTLKSENIWDDMTGLYNYRGFLDEMDSFRKAVVNDGHCICLVGVDIDRLGNINMAYGYTEGNYVIAALARVLKSSLRGRDFIGHLGSDEFVVAIECANAEDEYLNSYVEDLQESLDGAYEFSDKDYTVKLNTATYFIVESPEVASDEFVNNVLYVKQEDKDNRRKSDIGADQDYNNQDEQTVNEIIDNNSLRYVFQPIVSAKNGEIVAYEALMRSNTENMVSPLKILKYAEHSKRSCEVEKLTFFNVLSQISKEGAFPENAKIFINSIPGYLMNDEDYARLKEQYGSWFERLVVEITEQREIDDNTLVTINTRRSADGFNLAIDDYGSGCSNTNSLLRYVPRVVKLDRLLITGINRNAKKQFFVNSIISFARENDMLILAEGVETESELKTVIRLGVDMIQGYFTAKPAYEIIDSIPDNVKKVIVDENLKVGTNQRQVYTAGSSCELSVVHLAMEDYSKLNISGEFVTLTGSTEYTADMVIKIKDDCNVHLTLSDVRLNSVDDEPCITVGENSNLILNLEGHNRINAKGIYVPEGSSLTVIGTGNLEIFVKGHQCYAIGADTETSFGHLKLNSSGLIKLYVDGEECIGIGGGVVGSNSAVEIMAGMFDVTVAGVNAVGIGCYRGDLDINISDCSITSNFRVNAGTFIGCVHGIQNISIRNFNIELDGSGTEVSGIGSITETSGRISLISGTYKVKLNGHIIHLLGCSSGALDVDVEHARLELLGEGDNVLGFGDMDRKSSMLINDCTAQLIINASTPLGFGTCKETIRNVGANSDVRINGIRYDLGAMEEK